MGEAEKVERRVRIVRTRTLRPEVHKARLGLMEREPVATETFTQNVEHARGAPGVLEGHHNVVGKPHELARTSRPGLGLPLEPRIQHMVQEDVREHRADDALNLLNTKGNFRFERQIEA